MKAILFAAGASLLLAATALAQIPIPPHASIYNGYSRGFNFTANTPFVINQLALPVDAMQAGDTAGFLVRINGNVALYSVGNATASIPASLTINIGDVVDVIGNWSPAAPGSFTAHNWYGSTAPYSTVIEGVPHVLNRTGWQYDIGSASYTTGTYLAPTTGSLGRVLVYTAPMTGYASATPYGTGCPGRSSIAVYEQFAAGTADLTNANLMFLPGNDGSYTVVGGATPWFSGFTNNLALGDDTCATVTLPFAFPHAGGSTSTISVSSNGFLWLGNSTNAACCAGDSVTFQSDPMARIAALWQDLYPPGAAAGGGVFADLDPATGEFVVTWNQVPEYQTNPALTMQIAMAPTGVFHIRYQTVGNIAHVALAGYSMGAVNNGLATDLSLAMTTPVVTAGSAAPLTLGASARPVIGTSINLVTGSVPGSTTIGANVLGLAAVNPGFDLTPIGAPGCFQFVSPAYAGIFLPGGPTANSPLTVPNNPSLAGLHIYGQSVAFTGAYNSLGIIFSNGLDLGLDLL